MKLSIPKNQFKMSGEQFLRQAGYGFIRDHISGQDSYVRRLGSGFYPRLHMYCEENNNEIVFNLHLDQKQASYEGAHAHNAEYDGGIIKGEIDRLQDLINSLCKEAQKKETDQKKSKNIWQKIFS